MSISRSAVVGLFVSLLLISLIGAVTPAMATRTSQSSRPNGVRVSLSAAHSTTSWDAREPGRQKFELPLLYLHRERQATTTAERTLTIQFVGLAAAAEIQLEAVSLHQDVTNGASHTETTSFITPDRPCTAAEPCTVEWTLDAAMPSDLYSMRLKDRAGETLWESRERPAFVALDTWDVALGAYTVRVYYATLFPFARGQNDLEDRLSPHQVTGFVEDTFLPIIRETWQTQFVEWGFGNPLHPDWDSDDVIEIIITDPPYALLDGAGTYSRLTGEDGQPYPERRIWWYAANNSFQAYDTLENAFKAVFAHEFFHLMQWNVLLSAGGASTGRPADMWISWIEGQGRFAPAVQYPELEMSHQHLVLESSTYASGANRFLALHLNTSYSTLEADRANKYDSALYWRFLYEQYGDLDIIRAALKEMVSHYGPDTVSGMKEAMDAALARTHGPFHSFDESLVAFAQATYALRLENGRAISPRGARDWGVFADPDRMYAEPPLEAELVYTGTPLSYTGAVPTGYGMDFLEVKFDRSLSSQPLTVRFEGQGKTARFNIQVWLLGPGYASPRAVTPQPETLPQSSDGAYVYVISSLDTTAYDRLALIITRFDSEETADPVGGYQVTLESTEVPIREVRLSASHTTTSWDARDPERVKFDLPLLTLHREREVTATAERTLEISISGFAGGTELQVEAISQHRSAWTDEPHALIERFVLPDRRCTHDDPCTLRWTFDPATTLSDLYDLRIKSARGELLWSDPNPERPDFVILDTWDVEIGAYTVHVYYATLFPYARDPNRIDYRIPPEAVPGFIEETFVPLILDTWHTQFEEWEFGEAIHPDWDADKVVDVIITSPPYALFDGTGTYTVFTDSQGYPYLERRIWWLSTHAAFQRYDSWENAHRAIFAHEFFHLAQWNVLLQTGQPANFWLNTFIEAQAEFAVGVQYPELETGEGHVLAGSSAYGNSANLFLVKRLNTSYRDLEANQISKYDLALYWRFLYEQYGDMGVIRAALEEMARHYNPDILAGLEPALDAALARVPGPFHSFQESLVAFARANFALRLDAESQGRCAAVDSPECGGRYYDPDERYVEPPLEAKLAYDGVTLAHAGAIPVSYGMDFIEVHLDPALHGQPLTVRFQGAGEVAHFNVQVWKLAPGPWKPGAVPEQPAVMAPSADGAQVYTIPSLETETYDRLALIVTRLDPDEKTDPAGDYSITLDSESFPEDRVVID